MFLQRSLNCDCYHSYIIPNLITWKLKGSPTFGMVYLYCGEVGGEEGGVGAGEMLEGGRK